MAAIKKYKFITIQDSKHPHLPGRLYDIINNRSGDSIGEIGYYSPWKQYVFSSRPECVFNNSCLRDVLDFMENHAGKE